MVQTGDVGSKTSFSHVSPFAENDLFALEREQEKFLSRMRWLR